MVRPGNQRPRAPPPTFVFPPVTPPDTGSAEPYALPMLGSDWRGSFASGSQTPTAPDNGPPSPPSPEVKVNEDVSESVGANLVRSGTHTRSYSFSTVHGLAHANITMPGTFKVVIHKPSVQRPKTADAGAMPVIEVPIPDFKLGTPRFTQRGSAILRSSTNTGVSGTEGQRSSVTSRADYENLFPVPPGVVRYPPGSIVGSGVSRQARNNPQDDLGGSEADASAKATSPSAVPKAVVEPEMYDALTANPDDPSVVRFSPATGEIMAATPARLIAHITSPAFLDYELLSDFFLTFRSFLSTSDLVSYLVARLRWAVNRIDDFGRIVRVRTFVALRHWILNYFVDDFVPNYQLRSQFCHQVNNIFDELRRRSDSGGSDVNIIGDLKKCWRRTCALYWDQPGTLGAETLDDKIFPGGRIGSRDSRDGSQSPDIYHRLVLRPILMPTAPAHTITNTHDDSFRGTQHTSQQSLASLPVPNHDFESALASMRDRSGSVQAQSCSIPVRHRRRAEPGDELSPHLHPSTTDSANHLQSLANSKSNRPTNNHKRSGSFSDALRDHRAPLPLPKAPNQEERIPITIQYPGSLVRGATFRPGSPYMSIKPSRSLLSIKSHHDIGPVEPTDMTSVKASTATPGMKKLLSNVRRALSTRHISIYTSGEAGNGEQLPLSSTGKDSRASAAMPGHRHMPSQQRKHGRTQPQLRVDLLVARVYESYGRVTKGAIKPADPSRVEDSYGRAPQQRYPSVPHVGNGRSPMVFTDTSPFGVALMSGGLPPPQSGYSSEGPVRTAAFDSAHRGQNAGHNELRNLSIDGVVPGLEARLEPRAPPPSVSPSDDFATGIVRDTVATATSTGTGHALALHKTRSGRSGRSGSLSLRKYASYHSGMTRHYPKGSIDHVTLSDVRTESSDSGPFFLDRQPVRQLRRRPGGDLRAADNVHDLEPIQRPHSTGSLSNLSHSVTNSVVMISPRYTADSFTAARTTHPAERGAAKHASEAPSAPRRRLSLVETHSSQPILRPSFEAEVAKLAALPDDNDDDGGIESALLKLEGKYERQNSQWPLVLKQKMTPGSAKGKQAASQSGSATAISPRKDSKRRHRNEAAAGKQMIGPLPPEEVQSASIYRPSETSSSAATLRRTVAGEHSAVDLEGSYSSIPLLERGLSNAAATRRGNPGSRQAGKHKDTGPLSNLPSLGKGLHTVKSKAVSTVSSVEDVEETDSMRRIRQGATLPKIAAAHESFLLDENEELSDLSSELSTEITGSSEDVSQNVRSFFDDEPSYDDFVDDILPHPLRHPPTPPLTADRSKAPDTENAPFKKLPPSTIPMPTYRVADQQNASASLPQVRTAIDVTSSKANEFKAHLPFTLAHDAEIIAQQLTIIEKDAVDEIDWRELIELRWKQTAPTVQDWVEYLRTQEPRGVDIAIARFNLMVKWALSEVVLTEDVEERANCIRQFIHIAAYARRLRNYATMYQITLALLSSDCSRLAKTWERVPAADRQSMKELEALAQPLRNFHNLRMEMETAHIEDGCIPFIGKACLLL